MKIINSIFVFVFCFTSTIPLISANFDLPIPPQSAQIRLTDGACSKCIVVYGDSRTNHSVHGKIVKLIRGRQPETVFHTGDMVIGGKHQKSWDIFERITAKLRKNSELFPVHGNHEKHAQNYFNVFGITNGIAYYSLNRHGIHFTVIDSETPFLKGSLQYDWIESDLKKASLSGNVKFIAVVLHQPLFSSGKHGAEEKTLRARNLIPLFEKYGVSIVFSGHDHSYERSYKDGMFYIITAGGGAPLYDKRTENENSQVFIKSYHYLTISVSGDELFLEVFNEEDNLIDSFDVKKKDADDMGLEVYWELDQGI